MTLSDLPQEIQDKLNEERKLLHEKWKRNEAYYVSFANKEGTRYFRARRVCKSWNDDKGNYMPFGGGTYWRISYGAILWDRRKDPVGEWEYFWTMSGKKVYSKSKNGTEIPHMAETKKEVMAIAKAIGIFNI